MHVINTTLRDTDHNTTPPKRVLFVIQEVAHFHELFKIAKLLTATGRYEAHFIAYTTYPAIEQDDRDCQALNMTMHHGFYLPPLQEDFANQLNAWENRVRGWLGMVRRQRVVKPVVVRCEPHQRWLRRITNGIAHGLAACVWYPLMLVVWLANRISLLGRRVTENICSDVAALLALVQAGAACCLRLIQRGCKRTIKYTKRSLRWLPRSIRQPIVVTKIRLYNKTFELYNKTAAFCARAQQQFFPQLQKLIKACRKPLQPVRRVASHLTCALHSGIKQGVDRVRRGFNHTSNALITGRRAVRNTYARMLVYARSWPPRIAQAWRRFYEQSSNSMVRRVGTLSQRYEPPKLPGVMLHYLRRMGHFRALVREQAIDMVVLAEDNVGHGTGIFTGVARRFKLPVVTIPYTIANAREFGESYFEVPEHQVNQWPNRWLRYLFPRWVHTHRGRELMRMPGWHLLAHELLRIAPPRPWAYNSGYSSAIVVESEHTVAYYRRAGLKTEPLVALGSMFDDELAVYLPQAVERREALYRQLRLPPNRPLLLCALPPNQLPSRPHCPFQNFEQLVRAWLTPLVQVTSHNVVIRLHPRLQREQYAWIETELGLKISDVSTAQLVPLCDLYVASVSATIRWAVAAGKPVINYDVYEYCYDDYDDAAAVLTTVQYDEYVELVRRATEDAEYSHELQQKQQADRHRWGLLDGQAGTRILKLFDQLSGQQETVSHEDSHHWHGPNGTTTSGSRARQAA